MRAAIAMFCSLVATSAAGEFSLELPIDCTLDDTCYIQQFVDHDPLTGARDFQCGSLVYDGHKGTDFALPSLSAMADGVAVLAAAPGTIVGVRNDMPDILQTGPNAPDINNRECGNGVVIRHENGWETQYCHLAEGSVTVAPNQSVVAGDTLGMVGLSGQTQFPHLHLSVRRLGEVVDPFAPFDPISCNGPAQETLWSTEIATPPGGLITSGFASGVPEFDVIKAGGAHAPEINAAAPLVLWGYSFGGRAGDVITLNLTGPNGFEVAEDVTLDRTQAQLFRAFGKRAPDGGWALGTYTGVVTHLRDGSVLDQQTTQTTVISR